MKVTKSQVADAMMAAAHAFRANPDRLDFYAIDFQPGQYKVCPLGMIGLCLGLRRLSIADITSGRDKTDETLIPGMKEMGRLIYGSDSSDDTQFYKDMDRSGNMQWRGNGLEAASALEHLANNI